MARKGTPRLRHLKHRSLERTTRQPIITDFVTERAATLSQYANAAAVWLKLKTTKAEVIAAEASEV